MTFDPNNVRRYVIESRGQGDPGAVLVAARDFDQLLSLLHEVSSEADPAGRLAELRLLQDTVEAQQKRIAELEKILEASEKWRTAYQGGKGKLYSMGGTVAEAAMDHLPCNEGPLDRATWKAIGVPKIRSEVMQISHLEAVIEDMKLSRLKEEGK